MNTKQILGGALLLFAASCSNDDVLQSSATNGESNSLKTEFAALFKSADKESLKNTILDANLQNSTLTRSTLSQGSVSLLDVVQKVFNSQVKFFISSSMISNPLSFKALSGFVSGIRNLPVKRMKGGQVILAGKINGTWGGMKISKK